MKNLSPSKNKPRLLFDENIPVEIINKLSHEGFDVIRVFLGSEDKFIGKQAKLENRLIITSDKHFLDKSKFPPKEFAGIIFIDIHPPIIETIHYSLNRLFNSLKPYEFKGKLFTLSYTGFKVFPRD